MSKVISAEPWVIEYLLYGESMRLDEEGHARDGLRDTRPFTEHRFGPLKGPLLCHVPEVWAQLRDELLPAWIEKNPGTRPWAWWQVDAPEPRKREVEYTGGMKFEESELRYLDRHGLLLPIERIRRPHGRIRIKDIEGDGRPLLWRFVRAMAIHHVPAEADLLALAGAFACILEGKKTSEALGIEEKPKRGVPPKSEEEVLKAQIVPVVWIELLRADEGLPLNEAIKKVEKMPQLNCSKDTLEHFHKKHAKGAQDTLVECGLLLPKGVDGKGARVFERPIMKEGPYSPEIVEAIARRKYVRDLQHREKEGTARLIAEMIRGVKRRE